MERRAAAPIVGGSCLRAHIAPETTISQPEDSDRRSQERGDDPIRAERFTCRRRKRTDARFPDPPRRIARRRRSKGRTAMASRSETTKRAYDSFKRGDIPGLINDFIDDACIWRSPGRRDKLPWAGTFTGKQEISNFFLQVGEHVEFREFVPLEMIEVGNTVVVLGRLSARGKNANVVNIAIAREMVGFIWSIACTIQSAPKTA